MLKLEYCEKLNGFDKSKFTSKMKVSNCKQRNKLDNLHKEYNEYSSGKKKKCKKIPINCSVVCTKPYFKNWENATKSEHLKALAAPKPIRLKPWPNPCVEASLPLSIPKSALYGTIPERCHRLAIPIPRKRYSKKPITLCDSIYSDGIYNKKPKHRSHRDFTRSLELAKPRPKIKHVHKRCMNSSYKPEIRVIKTEKDWTQHQIWLKRNAVHKKKVQKPPELYNHNQQNLTKTQLEEMVERLNKVPRHRDIRYRERYVGKIEPRPFGHIIKPIDADWIQRLSVPKKISSETQLNLNYDPAIIRKSALTAVPSKRILELAEPKVIANAVHDSEYKINPYKVSPLALTYKATKRIKSLAIPRSRL